MRIYKHECAPAWHDFWNFVLDVKDPPPQKRARFRRIDEAKPFGPGNFFWMEVWRSAGDLAKKSAYVREYQRRLRATNPDYYAEKHFRKHYGTTFAWYQEQLMRQDGVCAICLEPETMRIRGKLTRLAIDHDHETGRVRGLLCCKCNRGIGLMGHDVGRLHSAIEYLKRTEQ